jgi:hypothetical protein
VCCVYILYSKKEFRKTFIKDFFLPSCQLPSIDISIYLPSTNDVLNNCSI